VWAELVVPSQAQGYYGGMNYATKSICQTSTTKALSCTDYEIAIKTIIPPETLWQLQ
jgi:hypothetical protein